MTNDEWDELPANVLYRRHVRFRKIKAAFDLIAFCKIADWCARKPGDIEEDEKRRADTYKALGDAVLQGEFGPPAKPCVVHPPHLSMMLPTHATIRPFPGRIDASQMYGLSTVSELWAPRALCVKWFVARQIAPPPWLSTAMGDAGAAVTEKTPETPGDIALRVRQAGGDYTAAARAVLAQYPEITNAKLADAVPTGRTAAATPKSKDNRGRKLKHQVGKME